MIPIRNILPEEMRNVQISIRGTQTFFINYNLLNLSTLKENEFLSLSQTIETILNTEQGQHIIYSPYYGLKKVDLIGKEDEYIIPLLKKRIKQALLIDDRITDVHSFNFKRVSLDSLLCSFVVVGIYNNQESININFNL